MRDRYECDAGRFDRLVDCAFNINRNCARTFVEQRIERPMVKNASGA